MFESIRLRYRKLDKDDFDLFFKLYSDKDVMKYAYLDRFKSKKDAIGLFRDVLINQDDQNKGTQYVAIIKETNVEICIVDYDVVLKHEDGGIFEIGYFIKPEFWGQGLGTEMAIALIRYIFNNFNVHKVVASCHINNRSSEKVMLKIGMKKEGVFRKARRKNCNWDDEVKYGLIKEEWMCKYEI